MIAAAATKPEDALSNIGGWAKLLGADRLAELLSFEQSDSLVALIGILMLIIGIRIWRRNREKSRNSPQSRLSVTYDTVAWGGRALENPDITNVTIIIRVSNVSDKPSSIPSWAMFLEREKHRTQLPVYNSPSRIAAKGWGAVQVRAQDQAIFEKTAKPIGPGEFVIGFLQSCFSKSALIEPTEGDKIVVEYEDVEGIKGQFETILKQDAMPPPSIPLPESPNPSPRDAAG